MLEEIYPYFEYASLFVALVFIRSYKKSLVYFYLLLYLLAVVIFETLGKTMKNNIPIFDVFIYLEYNLIALLYWSLFDNKKIKKVIIVSMVTFTLFHSLLYLEVTIRKLSVFIETILISLLAVFYFRELLYSNKILNYKKLLPFWLSVAFLLFFLTSIPFLILLYSNLLENRDLFPILHSIIILYNCCFIYGLIVCRKTRP